MIVYLSALCFISAISPPADGFLLARLPPMFKQLNPFSNLQTLLRPQPDSLPATMECIVFGNPGCEYVCDVKCRIFGCAAQGICTAGDSCQCRQLYLLEGEIVDYDSLSRLPFEDAWNRKFVDNRVSRTVRQLIQEDERTVHTILPLVQHPHVSGRMLKNKFKRVFPEAEILDELRPIGRGFVDDFVDQNWRFNFTSYKNFLDSYQHPTMKTPTLIPTRGLFALVKHMNNLEQTQRLARQILLFPSDSMIDQIINIMPSIRNIDRASHLILDEYIGHTGRELTPDQIDEIFSAGVLSKMMNFTTATRPPWF